MIINLSPWTFVNIIYVDTLALHAWTLHFLNEVWSCSYIISANRTFCRISSVKDVWIKEMWVLGAAVWQCFGPSLCVCPCASIRVCVRVCVDRKQVPSVYHSSIYSENKSQIWKESFYHLWGVRERKKEGGEESRKRKKKKRDGQSWGKQVCERWIESLSEPKRDVELCLKPSIRR